MNFESKTIIIAETNFIEELIHKIYIGEREFTQLAHRELRDRLQKIREVTRKNWGL
jgi:hypothetical protein